VAGFFGLVSVGYLASLKEDAVHEPQGYTQLTRDEDEGGDSTTPAPRP
jgi:hypothetical protein